MNPELLKKCLSGQADASEWIAYQLWLEGDPELEDTLPVALVNDHHGERIWEQVKLHNQKYDLLKRFKNRLIFSAAASLILLCAIVSLFRHRSVNVEGLVFRQGEHSPFLEKEFEGLRVKLGRDSKVKMQEIGGQMDVQFTGNMMLNNVSGRDRETEIFYKRANGTQISQKFRLKKNKIYYLACNPSNHDQLLIVEDRAFMDMPPVLARNLKSQFNSL